MTGLKLQGAKCVSNKLSVTDTILTELPITKLQWIRINPSDMYKMAQGKVSNYLHFICSYVIINYRSHSQFI